MDSRPWAVARCNPPVVQVTPPLTREQLAQLFDASPEPFSAFSAVRDEASVRDLRFVYANPAAARFFQRTAAQLEGQLLLAVAPSHEPIGLFERWVRVLESGEPDRHPFFYVAQGVSGWFRSLVCKWGDGITVQLHDETEHVVGGPALAAFKSPTSTTPERDLLEAMLRHLPAQIVLFSLPDFVFEYANDAFLTSGNGRELIGQSALQLFSELMDHPLAAGVRQSLVTGKAYVNPEVPLRMDFGKGLEERILSVVYQPVAGADGRPAALLGFHFDVTEQAQARACTEALLREKDELATQLEAERRWQKAVLTDVSQGLAVLAADGRLLFCNPRMEELLGRKAALAPRMVAELFPQFWPDGNQIPEPERPFHRAVTSGVPVRNVPVVYPHPDRGNITLDVSVAPVLDSGRSVAVAIITVDDVTERHQLEAERSAALAAEREARLEAEALATDLARSEERFRSLVETSSQAIWTTDWQGNVLTPIPGWAALTGQTPEETRGHGWLNAIHSSDVLAMQQMWREALRTPTTGERLLPRAAAGRRMGGMCCPRCPPLRRRPAGARVGGHHARRQRRAPRGGGAAAALQHRGRAVQHLGRRRDAAGRHPAGGAGAGRLLHRRCAAGRRDAGAGGGGARPRRGCGAGRAGASGRAGAGRPAELMRSER